MLWNARERAVWRRAVLGSTVQLGEEDQLLRNVAGISCYVSCLRAPQHSGDQLTLSLSHIRLQGNRALPDLPPQWRNPLLQVRALRPPPSPQPSWQAIPTCVFAPRVQRERISSKTRWETPPLNPKMIYFRFYLIPNLVLPLKRNTYYVQNTKTMRQTVGTLKDSHKLYERVRRLPPNYFFQILFNSELSFTFQKIHKCIKFKVNK